jgi:hypothetical protein
MPPYHLRRPQDNPQPGDPVPAAKPEESAPVETSEPVEMPAVSDDEVDKDFSEVDE